MSVSELKKYTLKAKYARYNKEAKRRESYTEAVNRVREMMLGKYPDAAESINWAYDQVLEEKVLGSQRALQFGGRPTIQHNARLYNCTCSYADRLRFFQESLYLLLCGCGVGFSVQKHHVQKLPAFPYEDYQPFYMPTKVFVVPDTIEGWADALGVLISSYFGGGDFPEYFGCEVIFDYSLVRPEGSPLSSGAGKAPGPEPLRRSLEKIRTLLNACIERGQERLRPIDVYDIVMHSSDAVLAGGVRRSATICIFSPDDLEMVNAKTGDWLTTNPQRARSNNSALLIRGHTSRETFAEFIKSVREWGEPGFVWADSTEFLVNPCVEIGMWPMLRIRQNDDILKDYKGPIGYDSGDLICTVSGWQFCNLCTINGGKIRTPQDFYTACRAAAIIGTLQAGFTDFPYLGRVSEEIVRREALLGVSITGMMDSPEVLLDGEVLQQGAKIVMETNAWLAAVIGIKPCARGTCLKPEGTASMLLGTLASGCHLWPFKRGIRHVQANRNEPIYKYFAEHNPEACVASVWDANKVTDVIRFPIEAPKGARIKGETNAVGFLSTVKHIYENWVVPGRRPECCTQDWLCHNVSNTVTVKPDEWDEVFDYIYDNRYSFAGISLLAASGDKDYEQAPNVAVYNPQEIDDIYGKGSFEKGLHLLDIGKDLFDNVFAMSYALEGNTRVPGWVAIVQAVCGTDLKKAGYLLKDVYYWGLYCELTEAYTDVNYEDFIEEEDVTKPQEEISCAGGACSLVS